MDRTIFMLTLSTACIKMFNAQTLDSLRIFNGTTAAEGKYPYVVCLLKWGLLRTCTGTLISSEWVVTAGHCVHPTVTLIQYNNFHVSPDKKPDTMSPIIRLVTHPHFRIQPYSCPINDIALARVQKVPVNIFAILSAIDYTSLMGSSVQYAGFGMTQMNIPNEKEIKIFLSDNERPLQVGEGVVTSCQLMKGPKAKPFGPCMCVTPKCSNKRQTIVNGDSGGPLFYENKIVGVACCGFSDHAPIDAYTAISPHITWIHSVVNS